MYDAIVASTLTVFSCLGVIVWMIIAESLKQSKRKDEWSNSRKIDLSSCSIDTIPENRALKSQNFKIAQAPRMQIKSFPYVEKSSFRFNDFVSGGFNSVSAG